MMKMQTKEIVRMSSMAGLQRHAHAQLRGLERL